MNSIKNIGLVLASLVLASPAFASSDCVEYFIAQEGTKYIDDHGDWNNTIVPGKRYCKSTRGTYIGPIPSANEQRTRAPEPFQPRSTEGHYDYDDTPRMIVVNNAQQPYEHRKSRNSPVYEDDTSDKREFHGLGTAAQLTGEIIRGATTVFGLRAIFDNDGYYYGGSNKIILGSNQQIIHHSNARVIGSGSTAKVVPQSTSACVRNTMNAEGQLTGPKWIC